jgi:hypothetical protein
MNEWNVVFISGTIVFFSSGKTEKVLLGLARALFKFSTESNDGKPYEIYRYFCGKQ